MDNYTLMIIARASIQQQLTLAADDSARIFDMIRAEARHIVELASGHSYSAGLTNIIWADSLADLGNNSNEIQVEQTRQILLKLAIASRASSPDGRGHRWGALAKIVTDTIPEDRAAEINLSVRLSGPLSTLIPAPIPNAISRLNLQVDAGTVLGVPTDQLRIVRDALSLATDASVPPLVFTGDALTADVVPGAHQFFTGMMERFGQNLVDYGSPTYF